MNAIKNDRLEVVFRYDPDTLFSERFESIGVIEQVILDGKYHFCEPEQRNADRVTCNGVGLCGEYVWDKIACEAQPGEQFPKLGVGLLKQRAEGGPYNMWKHYEVDPFPISMRIEGDRAVFSQEAKPCLGVAAQIMKVVQLNGTEIRIETTVKNVGNRVLDLNEYQHNFVSLNGLEVGPGYRLELPFDGTISDITSSAYSLSDYSKRLSGFMKAEGDSIIWLKKMDGHCYHKMTEQQNLHMEKGSFWRLTHENSPLSVSEKLAFQPNRVALWGIEHCICTEVYISLLVQPGQSQTWTRIWRFDNRK